VFISTFAGAVGYSFVASQHNFLFRQSSCYLASCWITTSSAVRLHSSWSIGSIHYWGQQLMSVSSSLILTLQ